MPNVLDVEPMRSFARRAGAKLPEGPVRDRFQRLAFAQLLLDERNFRDVTAAELNAAPDWARARLAQGDVLRCFSLNRSAGARLHNFARRLATVFLLAELSPAKQPTLTRAIAEAQRFIAKINHASFADLDAKSRELALAYKHLESEADQAALCDEQRISATEGRAWARIVSVSKLRATGREFHNCLAQEFHGHPEQLRRGRTQYWVLRGPRGEPLVVASAEAPRAGRFIEVRGPFNSLARDYGDDLKLLAAALGIDMKPRPRPPRPPRPPLARLVELPPQRAPLRPQIPSRALELLRAMEPPCPCPYCVRERTAALLLRVTAAS